MILETLRHEGARRSRGAAPAGTGRHTSGARVNKTLTVPALSHFHIWRVALTGKAAFMYRPYLKRDAATQAARRWSVDAGWRMVQECRLGEHCQEHCPRQPKPVKRLLTG